MTTLFVYGTLKRGGSRAHVLAEQRFVADARTAAGYRLYDCGSYPALVEEPTDGTAIDGELWEVDAACLAQLDEIEGVPEGLYRRGAVLMESPRDGRRVESYFYLRSVAGLRDCGASWEADGH